MIAVVGFIFAAVFLMILALYFIVSAARQSPTAELKRRLRRMAGGEKELEAEALTSELFREPTPAERFLYRLPLMRMLKKLVEHSGATIRPPQFLFLTAMAAASGFVVLFLLRRDAVGATLVALLLALGPIFYLKYRKQQREKKFDEQLPDVLTMVARSLRAGHSLTAAVELVGQEMAEPAGPLFSIAYEQQKLGMRMAESLGTLLDKIDSADLHFFVTIVRINSESGGNLSEILEKLAATITARLQIRRQVQVYTAEGRLSGYVLFALPIAVFCAFYVMRPEYMRVFFTEDLCRLSLGAAVLAQIAGFFVIRNIINIRI